MKNVRNGSKIAALLVCAGTPVMAQVNDVAPQSDADGIQPDRIARYSAEALGDPIAGPYNVENAGNEGQLGVDHAFRHYWITARDSAATNHQIWKYAEDGTFVKAFDQDIASKASAWGYRDGASDEGANQLYFGWDNGGFAVHDYDPATGDISVNCTQDVAGVGTIRALARTPAGTFVTKSFSGTIYEFDDAGATLNSWPDPGILAYGCAYDNAADSYWWNDNGGLVIETDSLMQLTGRSWDGRAIFTSFAAGGGLDLYEDARSPTGAAFVVLSQGTPDEIGVYEADAGSAGNNGNTTGPIGCNAPPPPPPPPPLIPCFLETFFIAGGGSRGTVGGVVYMDLTVGPEDLTFPGLEVHTSVTGLAPFQVQMWTRPTTYIGGECNASQWTLVAIGDGLAEGEGNMSRVIFPTPPTLAAGTSVGVALVGVNAELQYTNGTGANQAFSDSFMSLRLGGAQNVPFNCTTFNPRVWNGRYYYEPASGCKTCPPCACDFDLSTGPNVCDIFDFLAFQDAFVAGDLCACDFSISDPGGICDIFDFLEFQDSFAAGPCP